MLSCSKLQALGEWDSPSQKQNSVKSALWIATKLTATHPGSSRTDLCTSTRPSPKELNPEHLVQASPSFHCPWNKTNPWVASPQTALHHSTIKACCWDGRPSSRFSHFYQGLLKLCDSDLTDQGPSCLVECEVKLDYGEFLLLSPWAGPSFTFDTGVFWWLEWEALC